MRALVIACSVLVLALSVQADAKDAKKAKVKQTPATPVVVSPEQQKTYDATYKSDKTQEESLKSGKATGVPANEGVPAE